MKVIKNGGSIIVVTDDGNILHKEGCTNEMFEEIKRTSDKNRLLFLMVDNYKGIISKRIEVDDYLNRVKDSSLLMQKNNSIYWDGVSELSMPETLVNAVIQAEKEGDKEALEAYRNFWVLMSLNPDPECRKNLFWFLERWGMKIAKCGMFIGYRNVDIKEEGCVTTYSQELCDFAVNHYERLRAQKKGTSHYIVVDAGNNKLSLLKLNPEEGVDAPRGAKVYNLKDLYAELKAVNFLVKNIGNDTVYTDHHSHSFTIKVGEVVSMPREETDSDSNVSCSRGLHIGGLGWLKQCYFGTQGLVCLVNPAKVVAVPHIDNYGKLRTCEYLPIALVDYDETGNVIPYNVQDGFESKWVTDMLYEGKLNTEEKAAYAVEIPDIPELNKTIVDDNLLAIARTYMK